MRVLLTNSRLDIRAGSQLYVFDVARWLRAQGHIPTAYSARLGSMSDELRRAGVTVVDDPARIAEPPDVIHGQHHIATVTAMATFPNVPVVFFCHGWFPWEEMPVRHPQVRRYVAVSDLTRERLVSEEGIPPDRVRVIPNFVDVARYSVRSALPEQPTRALIYSNGAYPEASWVAEIRAACVARQIRLDVVGLAAGNATDHAERILPGYDLVFARGRAALEAMASGVAVILADVEGFGYLVRADRFERFRAGNFGVQVLSAPKDSQHIGAEIDAFDPVDAAQVTNLVRSALGRDSIMPRVLAAYEEAIADAAAQPVMAEEASAALARYLRRLDGLAPIPAKEAELPAEARIADLRMALADAQHALNSVRLSESGDAGAPPDVDRLAALRGERNSLLLQLEATEQDLDRARHEAAQVRQAFNVFRSGLLVGRVLPSIWRTRERIAPTGSRRHGLYRRVIRGGDQSR